MRIGVLAKFTFPQKARFRYAHGILQLQMSQQQKRLNRDPMR